MSTILISGGTGLIGSELKVFLAASGFQVNLLSRSQTDVSKRIFNWNLDSNYIDPKAFEDVFAVINLAGSSIIGGRWTKSKKVDLIESRIKSTQLLVDAVNHSHKITHFIQASAMGFYGDSGNQVLTESSAPGKDFMAKLCVNWEEEAKRLNPKTKLSILRIGLYLSKKGGVYKTIASLARFYLASSFGSGSQYVNYTHKDEFNQLVLGLLNNDLTNGTYNAVGKEACTLSELTKAIAKNENRAVILPNIPTFLLKLALGEASAALLNSYRITSPVLVKKKIHQYKDINEAVANL